MGIPEGVHLTDDQTRLAREGLQAYLEMLAAEGREGRVERILHEDKVIEVGDLIATLNARLNLLCAGCGTGPGYHCKMTCSTRRYGSQGPASFKLSVVGDP
jgi:hypothetical protein